MMAGLDDENVSWGDTFKIEAEVEVVSQYQSLIRLFKKASKKFTAVMELMNQEIEEVHATLYPPSLRSKRALHNANRDS